jgi:hypothetical protein
MNKVKCKDCQHYDVIKSGQTKNPAHGWCAVKSIYPMLEELGGPAFPPGVRRMDRADVPAKPEIVEGNSVVAHCNKVSPK